MRSLLPRPCRFREEDASSILQIFAGKFLVGDPASDNLFHDGSKPFRVREVPSVVAESLFVNVTEQVERFDTDIGSMQAALDETPEVLHGVGVDVSIDVLYGMVDDGVLVIRLQAIIGLQFIAEYRSARFD